MAINIKNLEEIIQKKAFATSPTTPVSDLGDIVEMSLLATNSIVEYDSAGALPTASTSNAKLAYVKSDRSLRLNTGTKWNSMASGGAQAGAEGGGGAVALFYQGVSNGYTLGGYRQNDGNVPTTTIQEYSLASDGNATDVGDFSSAVARASSTTSSSTHAYSAGGSPNSAVIHKVPFASGGTSTPVGQLSTNTSNLGGVTGPSHGYAVGGSTPGGDTNVIEKYSFSSDGNATDVGDTTVTRRIVGGGESETYGYAYGGFPAKNEIEKWPFASDENATDVGDLLSAEWYATGTAGSDANGYIMGATGDRTRIQKHSFTTDGNSTDVSNLTGPGSGGMGVSGVTHGYNAGGLDPGNNAINVIQKFPYAAETDATDVGDLVEKVWDGGTGAQV